MVNFSKVFSGTVANIKNMFGHFCASRSIDHLIQFWIKIDKLCGRSSFFFFQLLQNAG